MRFHIPRTLSAVLLAVFVAVAASAAPEHRSESGDWLVRQVDRLVIKLKKVFSFSPFDDINVNPPHP